MFTHYMVSEIDETTNIISGEVVFGVPGKDCRGHGICRVMEFKTKNCSCASTYVEIEKISSNNIKFHIPIGELGRAQYEKYFSTGVFLMEESFQLPDFICMQLNLQVRTIEANNYIIKSTKQAWEILFELV